MRFSATALLIAALAAAGCAVQRDLIPTGGSRADGTVSLSVEYNILEVPKIDQSRAGATAAQRCGVWGYSGAEPFGGSVQSCQERDMYGSCMRYMMTVTYQCMGAPAVR